METLQGWGGIVLNLTTDSSIVTEVPYPISEPSSLEVGAALFLKLNAKVLLLSGSDWEGQYTPSADVLENTQLPFWSWHKQIDDLDVLRIRVDPDPALLRPRLVIAEQLAPQINPFQLEQLMGPVDMTWSPPASQFFDWFNSGTFQKLVLPPASADRLFASLWEPAVEYAQGEEPIDAYLQKRRQSNGTLIAARDRLWRIKEPDIRQKIVFAKDLIAPLLQFARDHKPGQAQDRLLAISIRASLLGFDLVHYHCSKNDARYLILEERPNNSRLWGTTVFRIGRALPIGIEVPRPVVETNTITMGFWLFRNLNARAMLWPGAKTVSGAHPLTDAISTKAVNMPFNFTHQELQLFASPPDHGLGIIQVRGFSEVKHPEQRNVVVSVGWEVENENMLSSFQNNIVYMLEQYGLSLDFFDNTPEMIDFGIYSNLQYTFSMRCCEDDFITLWFPASVRRSLKHRVSYETMTLSCKRQRIAQTQGNLVEYLKDHKLVEMSEQKHASIRDNLDSTIVSLLMYEAYRNENYVSQITKTWTDAGFDAICFSDPAVHRKYFVFLSDDVLVAVNPMSLSSKIRVMEWDDVGVEKSIQAFRKGQAAMLMISE
jgi:hypothetical protein